MRALVSVALAATVLTLSPASSSGRSVEQGPFLLATLASLGTVTWRCDGRGGHGFGYRASPRFADTEVVLRSGGRIIIRRRVQPGDRLRLPSLRAEEQRLSFVQATEPRTLRASLKVDFAPATASYCRNYWPPETVVTIRLQQN